MLGKKLVTAQKRGETRALFLGLGMVLCSMIMYFFIGITIVPAYKRSFRGSTPLHQTKSETYRHVLYIPNSGAQRTCLVWTNESVCRLMKASIKEPVHCTYNEGSGDENIFRYPCLEVEVNLTLLGQVVKLYHTEDTMDKNPECSYVPPNIENYNEVQKQVEEITENFRKQQTFSCYYDPSRKKESVILKRLYPPEGLFFAFIWPSLMLLGGVLIIIMVKISQYFSVITTSQHRTGT